MLLRQLQVACRRHLSSRSGTGDRRGHSALAAVLACAGTIAALTLPLSVTHAGAAPARQPLREAGPQPAHAVINGILLSQVAAAREPRLRARTHGFLGDRQQIPNVHLEVASTRDIAGVIRSLGGTVEADINGRVTAATLPANKVATLANQAGVRELFPSLRLHPDLDLSVPEIRANQVWNIPDHTGLPIRGDHVLVGIVDSGIDYHNPDFKNPDGTTRIKYIWDQTQDGNAPSGFSFGYECDANSINNGSCPERALDPHGTHVAGIAAGNGRSSNPAREIGVAPEADIIVVKSDLDTDKIIAAWKYLVNKAQQLGEPLVVNCSFGGQISPHDGTDPDALAVDQLSGPGRIFVVSAGNEGNKGLHTSGTIGQGGTATVQVKVSGIDDAAFALFYPNQDRVAATLTNTNTGETFGPVSFGDDIEQQTSRDGETKVTLDVRAWDSSHHSIYVEVDRSASGRNLNSTWQLTLTGTHVVDNGRYDAWLATDIGATFTNPDETDTIGDPADAHSVITVGNYATRLSWTASDGQTYSVCEVYICLNNTLALGDIKASSSRGPTEDGRQKPDIAAPGTMIISSITHDAPICSGDQQDNCLDPMMITPDGNNYVESGTSMSAPHVAGVIALMLQVNPRLDPNTVDSILRRTARHDQFTGSANWTPSFGAGKIDALAAVQAVLGGSQAPQPTPTKPVTLPTPIPATSLSFHILAARPQKSGSKPNLSGSVLTHGQIGKKMSLYIYLEIQSIPDNSRVLLEWTVKKNGTTLGYNSNQKTFNHADTGDFWARYSWTPRRSGTYTFVGRVTINGQSSEGSSVFTVGRK